MEQRTCPLCKRPVLPKLAFCPYDGTKVGKAPESKEQALPRTVKLDPNFNKAQDNAKTILDDPEHHLSGKNTFELLSETRPLRRSELFPLGVPQQPFSILTAELPPTERAPFREEIIEAPQDAPFTTEPGSSIGEYILEKQIGSGGMGMIWSAKHPTIGKQVAIKFLHLDRITHKNSFQRFVQEAKAVNQINHPNLIDIFSFGKLPDGRPYFVMEYLRGKSLQELIDEKGPLPLRFIQPIFEQICDVMQVAHEKGIIHRDLKPDNIFLCETREQIPFVKLLDFGIAKLAHDTNSGQEDLTKTGSIIGTLGYMAPEQIQRSKSVSHKADIYSLGVILYEVLVGKGPFDNVANNVADVLISQMQQDKRPSKENPERNIPATLDAFVQRAMAQNPEQRPKSCREFFEELSTIIDPLEEQILVKNGQITIIPDPLTVQNTEKIPSLKLDEVNQAATETVPIKAASSEPTQRSSIALLAVLGLLLVAAIVVWSVMK